MSAVLAGVPPLRKAPRASDDEEWEEEDEWEDDEEWSDWDDEDEDWEDDEPSSSRRRSSAGGQGGVPPLWPLRLDAPGRGLALGFVAMLPLFIGYEFATDGTTVRSVAEAILTYPLRPLGPEKVVLVRRLAIAALGVVALATLLHRIHATGGLGLGPRLLRVVAEGVLGAVLLGPVLLAASRMAEPYVGAMVVGAPSTASATPSRAAFVMGGGAYEEVVFRVGALSVAWLIAKHFLHWFGVGERLARPAAALAAVLLSSLLFAAFHLRSATSWLGPGGEPFDAAVFTWRTTAGILLAVLFFWRGVGVAAWTHAAFNLSLLIGAGPNSMS